MCTVRYDAVYIITLRKTQGQPLGDYNGSYELVHPSADDTRLGTLVALIKQEREIVTHEFHCLLRLPHQRRQETRSESLQLYITFS